MSGLFLIAKTNLGGAFLSSISRVLFFLRRSRQIYVGTIGAVLVVVGDHFWNLHKCSSAEMCSKVARYFNFISKPKLPLAEVC